MAKQPMRSKICRVPTILQMEAVECGAASLAMIMAYYEKYISLEELRIECDVSRDGSKASNILKAAQKYGFIAKGYSKEPEELAEMTGPLIVHWNFNHFVVLEGMKKNKVYLNDPAFGRRIISKEEFDQSFTGVVLTFEKDTGFKKTGEKKKIITALLRKIKGSETGVIYVILTALALVVTGIIIPVYAKIFVDNILLKEMKEWLGPLLIGMIITAVIRGLLTWLQGIYLIKLEAKIALTETANFFWYILRLPVQFFKQRYSGEIADRITVNDTVATLVTGDLARAAIDFLLILFYLIIMLQYDLILTLAGMAIAGLNLFFLKLMTNRLNHHHLRMVQDHGKLTGFAVTGLQLIETLKANGREDDFFTRWSGYQAKLVNSEQSLNQYAVILRLIPLFLTMINNALILILGGFRVLSGSMTLGMLVAFQSLMASFLLPVNNLVNLGLTIENIKGDVNRLDDIYNYQLDPLYRNSQEQPPYMTNQKLEGYLELKNLMFGYNHTSPPLIENFNLKLEPGTRVALVGGSGSGKSTIAKLIAGVYEPWDGEILFDGKKRLQIPRNILTSSLAMVDQDIALFKGSFKDNLTLWDPTLPMAAIIQAAKDASIHEDIASRKSGYDDFLEEGGKNFSGGQRQRLEIARALVIDPRIIILDEATSALDPKIEQVIDENIRRRGCTCIIIAHRLSTIRDCEEIIVLDKGKIIERGNHTYLKEQNGVYAALIKM